MKKLTSSIIGGIAGAVALNILHQTVKQFVHEAPRVENTANLADRYYAGRQC